MFVLRAILTYIALVTIATCGLESVHENQPENLTTDVTTVAWIVSPVTPGKDELATRRRIHQSDGREANSNSYDEPHSAVNSTIAADRSSTESSGIAEMQLCDEEYKMVELICSIACPTLLAVGTLGNILSFITLRSKSIGSSSTNFILSTMLVVDQTILSVNLLDIWLAEVFDFRLVKTSSVGCFLIAFLGCCLHQLCAFLVCLLAAERLIAVYVPLRYKQLCSPRRIKIVCFSAFVVYFLFHTTTLSVNRMWSYPCIQIDPNVWFSFYRSNNWPCIDAILATYIPATLLIGLNSLIVYKIVASRCAMQTNRADASSSANAAGSKLAFVTIMMFVESAVFLLINVPLEIVHNSNYLVLGSLNRSWCVNIILTDMPYPLSYISSTLNFALYMLTGRKFRKAFVDTLCRPTEQP